MSIEQFKVSGNPGTQIFRDIFNERCGQDAKWGIQDHSQIVWLGILSEEFGEVAKEINELHFRDNCSERRICVRNELIQVAAVAVAMLESLERNGR